MHVELAPQISEYKLLKGTASSKVKSRLIMTAQTAHWNDGYRRQTRESAQIHRWVGSEQAGTGRERGWAANAAETGM